MSDREIVEASLALLKAAQPKVSLQASYLLGKAVKLDYDLESLCRSLVAGLQISQAQFATVQEYHAEVLLTPKH